MFDIGVLIVVGLLTLRGLWRGFVRQVVGLVGVAAGYVLAMRFYGPVAARFLSGFSPAVGHIVAFVAIFVACMIAASIIGWIAGRAMSGVGLGPLNRIAGGLLVIAKGCFVVAVVTLALIVFLPSDGLLKSSRTVKYILPMSDMIAKVAPASIRTKYEVRAARLRHPGYGRGQKWMDEERPQHRKENGRLTWT